VENNIKVDLTEIGCEDINWLRIMLSGSVRGINSQPFQLRY
jgi:hypothetical protein